MLKAAKISATTMQRSIFTFAVINCAFYILFALSFKFLNMLHIWGLNMINFFALGVISIFQVHNWIRKTGGYVPFLQAFFTVLFTGSVSFILFAFFILIYSLSDPYFAKLFITHTENTGRLIAPIVVFFEGTGGSIIIGLIASFYAARYEDQEVPIKH